MNLLVYYEKSRLATWKGKEGGETKEEGMIVGPWRMIAKDWHSCSPPPLLAFAAFLVLSEPDVASNPTSLSKTSSSWFSNSRTCKYRFVSAKSVVIGSMRFKEDLSSMPVTCVVYATKLLILWSNSEDPAGRSFRSALTDWLCQDLISDPNGISWLYHWRTRLLQKCGMKVQLRWLIRLPSPASPVYLGHYPPSKKINRLISTRPPTRSLGMAI